MMSPAARRRDVPARVAETNEFWRLGGRGGNVPFNQTPGVGRGYGVNPNAAPASELFPQPHGFRSQVRGPDYALTAGYGVDAVVMEVRAHQAHEEVKAAREDYRKDPTEANLSRLQRALDMEGFWTAAARTGQMAIPAHALTTKLMPYQYPRPGNVAAAEAEMMRLNRLAAPPPKKRRARK
jgi:hypothetical protein